MNRSGLAATVNPQTSSPEAPSLFPVCKSNLMSTHPLQSLLTPPFGSAQSSFDTQEVFSPYGVSHSSQRWRAQEPILKRHLSEYHACSNLKRRVTSVADPSGDAIIIRLSSHISSRFSVLPVGTARSRRALQCSIAIAPALGSPKLFRQEKEPVQCLFCKNRMVLGHAGLSALSLPTPVDRPVRGVRLDPKEAQGPGALDACYNMVVCRDAVVLWPCVDRQRVSHHRRSVRISDQIRRNRGKTRVRHEPGV